MKSLVITAAVLVALTSGAAAQETPKIITLQLDAQQVQVLWAGLQELPGKIADPVKSAVQAQIKTQTEAAQKVPKK